MNIDGAGMETMWLAYRLHDTRKWREPPCPEMSYEHIKSMWERWTRSSSNMSDDKKNRWLGWMQATIVAMTCPHATLEMMKDINRRCAD